MTTTPAPGAPQPNTDATNTGEEGAREGSTAVEEGGGGGGGGGGGKDVDEIVSKEKRSPFFNILAEWTWGQVYTLLVFAYLLICYLYISFKIEFVHAKVL